MWNSRASGLKTRRTEFGQQSYRDPNFSDCFWTASSHNEYDTLAVYSGRMVRESASDRFSPPSWTTGGRGVGRTGKSQPTRSFVPGSHDEGKTTCKPGRVVEQTFPPRCLLISYINIFLVSPRRRLPSSSTRQVVAALGECRDRICELRGAWQGSRSRHHHNPILSARGDARRARGWVAEHSKQQTLLLAWQIDASCTAVFGIFERLCDTSHGVWKPVTMRIQMPFSDADVVRKWGSISGWTEEFGLKKGHLRGHKG